MSSPEFQASKSQLFNVLPSKHTQDHHFIYYKQDYEHWNIHTRVENLGHELHPHEDTMQVHVYMYKTPGATLYSIIPKIRELNKWVHFDSIYIMVGNNDLTHLETETYRVSVQAENTYDIL